MFFGGMGSHTPKTISSVLLLLLHDRTVDKLDNYTSSYIDDKTQYCKYNDDNAPSVFYHGDHDDYGDLLF